MIEANCNRVLVKDISDAQLGKSHPNNEQLQALITLHRTLLCEHYDFFIPTQHPNASRELRRYAAENVAI